MTDSLLVSHKEKKLLSGISTSGGSTVLIDNTSVQINGDTLIFNSTTNLYESITPTLPLDKEGNNLFDMLFWDGTIWQSTNLTISSSISGILTNDGGTGWSLRYGGIDNDMLVWDTTLVGGNGAWKVVGSPIEFTASNTGDFLRWNGVDQFVATNLSLGLPHAILNWNGTSWSTLSGASTNDVLLWDATGDGSWTTGAVPNQAHGLRINDASGVELTTNASITNAAQRSIAIGLSSTVTGDGRGIAIGPSASATGGNGSATSGIAIGSSASVSGAGNGVAVGGGSSASAGNATAIGPSATASAGDSIAIGGATASSSGSIAIGSGVTANQTNGIFLKHNSNIVGSIADRMAGFRSNGNELIGTDMAFPYTAGSIEGTSSTFPISVAASSSIIDTITDCWVKVIKFSMCATTSFYAIQFFGTMTTKNQVIDTTRFYFEYPKSHFLGGVGQVTVAITSLNTTHGFGTWTGQAGTIDTILIAYNNATSAFIFSGTGIITQPVPTIQSFNFRGTIFVQTV